MTHASVWDEDGLPQYCAVCIPVARAPIVGWARRAQSGIRVSTVRFGDAADAQGYVTFMNRSIGVSDSQAFAMLVGSMLGWDHERARVAA
jgi:hypothetical protein